MGLPLHHRGDDVYRVIGDQFGSFVEADETSVDLGFVRLRICSSEGTPSRVAVRGSSLYQWTVIMGFSDLRLQQGRWVDLVDGLALVVRPEVVEDEVALDTGVSDDDDPNKENFCSGDGML
ncbi:hypothetical protein LOK49_LG06G01423 [Camellia lanceoleosa]|uniref:Uncharacterized protein n=1 Tax=Camellia lanceoleosa TaxID=1840588 RepID=A0ACC0HFH9_9ERIC|nr:hypothetical protein LOK49_LG06G01423 [Camellia lanceoleosa]